MTINLNELKKPEAKEERIVTPEELQSEPSEERVFEGLRPKTLDDFIGQRKIKENLRVFIDAARIRKEPLDHVLLSGPAWSGQDHVSPHHRPRDGCQHPYHLRSGHRAARRPGGYID